MESLSRNKGRSEFTVVSESKATHLLSDLSWELANGQEGSRLRLERPTDEGDLMLKSAKSSLPFNGQYTTSASATEAPRVPVAL